MYSRLIVLLAALRIPFTMLMGSLNCYSYNFKIYFIIY